MFPSRKITTLGGDKFRDEYSLAFDGSDERLHVAAPLGISEDDAWSFSCWFNGTKTESGGGGEHACLIWGEHLISNGDNKMRIGINNNATGTPIGGIYYSDSRAATAEKIIFTDNATATSGTQYNDGVWRHVTLTRAAGAGNQTIKCYMNGVELTNKFDVDGNGITPIADPEWATSLTRYSIGCDLDTDGGSGVVYNDFFRGNMSDIAWFDKELTASQVKTLYNGREPYNHKEGIASGNLKAWWRMGDGAFDSFNLISDENNSGIGSDLVTNGTFAADSDWTKGTGWTISGGTASCDGSQSSNSDLYQEDVTAFGSPDEQGVWKVTFTVSGRSAGTLQPGMGGYQFGTAVSADGTYTDYILPINTSSNARVYLRANSSFVGNVDNVSVQLVSGNAGHMENMEVDNFTGDTP